jgi:hypothetical protein
MTHISLYALREDLVDLLRLVESEGPLKYALTGNFLKTEVESGIRVFETGVSIPNLGAVGTVSSAAYEEFLVCKPETPIHLRVAGRKGERVCVDQLANPDSVTFTPSGIWNDGVVLEGRIATASDSEIARALMKRFHAAISKTYSKVNNCYVGPNALVLLHEGKRFTSDAQSPPTYDLIPFDSATQRCADNAHRLSYEDSYRLLRRLRFLSGSPGDNVPSLPTRRPTFDDTTTGGVVFFRTRLAEIDFESLTLQRVLVGRSEIESASFKNADMRESTLCWNDFNSVNFSDADLSDCDLRASIFRENSFVRANLRNADLRRSNFEECDFTDADMRGAKLTRKQCEQIRLSDKQKTEIEWQESDGDQPPGG